MKYPVQELPAKALRARLGILIKSPGATQPSVVEIIHGLEDVFVPLNTSLIVIGDSPLEWQPVLIRNFDAVIVVLQDVTAEELDVFHSYHVPFLCVEEWLLTRSDLDFLKYGQCAAESLHRVISAGEYTGEIEMSWSDSLRRPKTGQEPSDRPISMVWCHGPIAPI